MRTAAPSQQQDTTHTFLCCYQGDTSCCRFHNTPTTQQHPSIISSQSHQKPCSAAIQQACTPVHLQLDHPAQQPRHWAAHRPPITKQPLSAAAATAAIWRASSTGSSSNNSCATAAAVAVTAAPAAHALSSGPPAAAAGAAGAVCRCRRTCQPRHAAVLLSAAAAGRATSTGSCLEHSSAAACP